MDDFYTDVEQRAIDTAGRLTAQSLQALRDRDEREWREPYVRWDAVSAGHGPEQPTDDEGASQ